MHKMSVLIVCSFSFHISFR